MEYGDTPGTMGRYAMTFSSIPTLDSPVTRMGSVSVRPVGNFGRIKGAPGATWCEDTEVNAVHIQCG